MNLESEYRERRNEAIIDYALTPIEFRTDLEFLPRALSLMTIVELQQQERASRPATIVIDRHTCETIAIIVHHEHARTAAECMYDLDRACAVASVEITRDRELRRRGWQKLYA